MVRLSESSIEPIEAYYVRSARRLRAQYASQPGRMHRALRELSPPAVEPVLYDPTPAERFATRVIHELEGGLLRYSARLNLLKQAAQMGMGRFEANLIIAAVQHRQPKRAGVSVNGRFGVMPLAIVFAAVQALIAASIW